MTEVKRYPVVLRMKGMFPPDLGGYERHRTRKGGDLGHVDATRSPLNRRLIGSADWAAEVQAEIAEMTAGNFAAELDKLRKRRRKTEAKQRIAEGPRAPWRATRHGPLREVILTANKEWFEGYDETSIDDLFGDSREARFESLAVSWLQEHFGEDVIHARADLDEEAYHIHAVILPRAETKDGRRMLQPSKHAMIRDYEAAQDSVGAWFAELGLTRGEQRAKEIREAKEHNALLRKDDERVEVPEQRDHLSPADWRKEQERKLAKKDKALATKAQQTEAVLAIARSVAKGEVDLSQEDGTQVEDDKATTPGQRLFGAALHVLRSQARNEARDEVREALQDIEGANRAIVGIAKHLPRTIRDVIGGAHRTLARHLTRLRRRVGHWDREEPDRGSDR